MMTCPHGMPRPSTCFSCMEDGPVAEPARWRRVGSAFAARYPTVCADESCGGQVHVGNRVQRWDRGGERTVYCHERCSP